MKILKFIVITIIAISLNMFCVTASTPNQPVGYTQSLLNVCDYGAIPNDGKDDTDAFFYTLNKGDSVYIPAGVYDISESLIVNRNLLIGCGTDKTVIRANLESRRDPIIWAGGRAQIRDLTIKFHDSCIKGTEIAGERVGIMTTAKGSGRLSRGGGIMNVRIENVGTGIYSCDSSVLKAAYNLGTGTNWSGDACAFNAAFESVSVVNFSYRGFDMQHSARTGNVFRNIYLSSGKYEANAGIYFSTEESELAIAELTIADSKLKTPVRFNDISAVAVTNINFINTELTQDNTAFLYVEHSVAHIGGITFKNSAPVGSRQSFIRAGDNSYRHFKYDSAGYIYIDNMNIINPDSTVTPDSEQYMIARKNGYLNEFTVEIDNFNVVAPEQLKAQYEAFKIDDRDLKVIVNGVEK